MAQPDVLFAYDLARELGIADADGLLASMTTQQIRRWMAHQFLHQWGFHAEERRHVTLCMAASEGRLRPDLLQYKPPWSKPLKDRAMTANEIRRQMAGAMKWKPCK